jgi:(S)-ureidoglycine aminohydrolase
MEIFGSTRSRVRRGHALIAPDSFVQAPLPGWHRTQGVIVISPQLGARFTQYFALMEREAVTAPTLPGVERFVFVLEGRIALDYGPARGEVLREGGYLYTSPNTDCPLRAEAASRLNVFEKRYTPRSPEQAPKLTYGLIYGQEQDVEAKPFLNDPDALLKTLLPDQPDFDLAVNIFTYRPGATLPLVEVHVMEHGLLMLQGQGVYRLGDDWYPVREGDVIWMAPYCPQWFVAMGKGPARYLYYKDVNRDPLQSWP